MKRCAVIVDDNRALAEDLGEILHSEGFDVRVFFDPVVASQTCDGLNFQLALLDVRMPGMDGVELYRVLSRKHPGAHFILMSAYADDRRLKQALDEGVTRILTKPLSVPELVKLVQNVVDTEDVPVGSGGST
ncbi:MAG: response regulator [Myxococcales bacterium]